MNQLYIFIALVLVLTACDKAFYETPPKNTPLDTYQAFWQGYEDYYVEFELKKINWDSMRQVYEPQITTATTEQELYNILKQHLDYLQDAHSSIYPLSTDAALIPYTYNQTGATNFLGFETLKTQYLDSVQGNNAMKYSWVKNENIGYIWIPSFGLSSRSYFIIDDILRDFELADAIIIDVRNNGGGAESTARSIASRFIDADYVYSYVQRRTGIGYELEAPQPYDVELSKFTRFNKKIALLTNKKTFSAAEGFALMLRGKSGLIQVGDATQGGSGTTPTVRELPNGWSHRLSVILVSDADLVPINNGVQPTHFSAITTTDSLNQVDRILEDAVNLVR